MTPDYRALCAELIDALAEWRLGGGPPEDTADADLIARARTLLAQPEPEAPIAWGNFLEDGTCVALSQHLEDIARWLNPKPLFLSVPPELAQPVAVSERLPGPEDCNAEGMCWWLIEPYPRPVGPGGKLWSLCRYFPGSTHWLPANALPTPEATND